MQLEGVTEVHDLHVWSLKPGVTLLAAHVNIASCADATQLLKSATDICRRAGTPHTTIQFTDVEHGCPCAAAPVL